MSDVEHFITFHPQPDFPVEDISDQNAEMAKYYLEATHDVQSYVGVHRQSLQVLHGIGNSALKWLGKSPADNKGEYIAYCHGFTTVDYIATLLNSRPFVQLASGVGMDQLYIQPDSLVDIELGERIPSWRASHENVLALLLDVSDRCGETSKQFDARLVGAQTASELLLAR